MSLLTKQIRNQIGGSFAEKKERCFFFPQVISGRMLPYRPAKLSSRLWRWGSIDLQSYLPDFGAGQHPALQRKTYIYKIKNYFFVFL